MGRSGGSGGSLWCCGDCGVWHLCGVWLGVWRLAIETPQPSKPYAIRVLRHVWHVWRLICPTSPLCRSAKMFVRSSASLGRDPSRTNDMGSPKQDLDSVWRTCAINSTSSSRSKERRTNATNATHATKPYAVRLSGRGVLVGQMPQTPHRLHQTPHASWVMLWP